MEHAGFSAVIFLSGLTARAATAPSFFSDLLFRPVAAWTLQALSDAGAERFFLVCDPDQREQAQACLPAGAEAAFAGPEHWREPLCSFLGTLGGSVAVLTQPLYLSAAGAQLLSSADALPSEGIPSGLYRMTAAQLTEALPGAASPAELFSAQGEEFLFFPQEDTLPPLLPIFDFGDLLGAATVGRFEILARHLAGGVRILDPNATYIDPQVKVGRGTLLLPGTILRGDTVIGEDCEIGPNSMVCGCTVGDQTVINSSQCNDSTFGSRVRVGPFAYVRPGCTIGDEVKLGDFVEVKNSVLEEGVKVSHLTYVGDADIGARANLGCGTVTVNYDGAQKFRTVIGADSFVGCNTNLVAPVCVGAAAYVAAGSTITQDIPPGSLAFARARQLNKENWKKRRK